MSERIKVDVTQEHIDKGVRRSDGFKATPMALCMIELAVKDRLGFVPIIGYMAIYNSETKKFFGVVAGDHIPKVTKAINAFDGGKPVEPFSFEVEPREPASAIR